MRRFELTEGKSSKFWQIDLDGKKFTVNFGRIGTAGQTQTKEFPTEAKAQTEHDKLVKEKTGKGYAEVAAEGTLTPVAPKEKAETPAAPPPTPEPEPAPTPVPAGETEPHVLWTPQLLAGCAPTSRSTLVAPSLPTAEVAWKRIHKASATLLTSVELGNEPALKELSERVVAMYSKETPTQTNDVALHAAAWSLLSQLSTWGADTQDDNFSAFLTRAFGLGFMFDCFVARPPATINYNTRVLIGASPPVRLRHDMWRALSRCWLSASEEERTAQLPRVRSWLTSHENIEVRVALAVMLDDDAATCATVAQLPPAQSSWSGPPLEDAGLLTAPDAKEATARAQSKTHLPIRSLNEIKLDLLLRFGVDIEPLFIAAVKAAHDADTVRAFGQTLALISSSGTARFMAGSLGVKELRPIAVEYLAAHAQLTFGPVAEVAAGKGPAAEAARSVLRGMVASHPALANELAATATPSVKALIEETKAMNQVEDAPEALLPPVLREVPWKQKKQAPVAAVKNVSIAPVPPSLNAELRETLKAEAPGWSPNEKDAISRLERVARGEKLGNWQDNSSATLLLAVPKDVALNTLNTANLSNFGWSYYRVPLALLHRYELEVLPALLRLVNVQLYEITTALFYVDGSAPALAFAQALKLKKQRATAQSWLLRQPKAAAAGLIPTAVGPKGTARTAAEDALRFLSSHGHREAIEAVAREAGALDAVQAVLDFDPLMLFPKKIPALPGFYAPGAFTRPRLTGNTHALPLAAMETVGTMLAMSTIETPYAGVEQLKAACDARSLAQFSWELFQAWNVAGAPSKENWAFQQLGLLGDDAAARALTPLIRAWPGEGGHARAVTGLEVLAKIGSDVALMNLHGIAQKVKFKGLQEKAKEKIEHIAEERGLTADELADRLVPDLGLDDDGTRWLDFGPRRFKVVFDETLQPSVLEEGSEKPGDLPKPKKSDDAEKAKLAVEEWKAMKKDAKTIAADQVRRLKLAMSSQRRWSREVFEQFLLGHPLMIHLVRRLAWGVYDEADVLTASFRVAEDRSLADANDDAFTLPDDARLGVLHALDLTPEAKGQWGQVFADYEIIQPFEQLARLAFSLTPEEAKATELTRVKDLSVPTGKVLGLYAHGWRMGAPQDGGGIWWAEKPTNAGTVYLDLDPGLIVGMPNENPTQKLGSVSLTAKSGWLDKRNALPFGTLSRIEASELLRDLETLKES